MATQVKIDIFNPFGVYTFEHNNKHVSYLTKDGYYKMLATPAPEDDPYNRLNTDVSRIEKEYAPSKMAVTLAKAFSQLMAERCSTEKAFWGTNYHTKNGIVETEYGTIKCESICVEKGSPTKCCTYVPEFSFIEN